MKNWKCGKQSCEMEEVYEAGAKETERKRTREGEMEEAGTDCHAGIKM